MSTRPSKMVRWADVGGSVVEPPDATKDIGWAKNQRPPSGFQNWWQRETSKWLDHHDGFLLRNGLWVRDEFTGSAIDTGTWTITVTGGSTPGTADDAANDGYGTARLFSNGQTYKEISLLRMPVGTADFWFECRLRVAQDDGGFHLGFLESGSGTTSCSFKFNPANYSGRWYFAYGLDSGPTTVDLGITPSATYQRFRASRTSGVVEWAVDGVALDDDAMAGDIDTTVNLRAIVGPGVTDADVYVDYFALWVDRA